MEHFHESQAATLARVLGELGTATLTDAPPASDPWRPNKVTVYVSYVPQLRSFSAHREGLGEIRASSMRGLLARLTELWPEVELTLVLSKVAQAEVAARRKGVPRAEGWS